MLNFKNFKFLIACRGKRLVMIKNSKFLTVGKVKRPILHHCAKFCKYQSRHCWNIAIFVIFEMAAAAILDFQKCKILTTTNFNSRSLLQPDSRRHRSPQRTVSPIRRQHTAPSRHACSCWQHTSWAVCSHRVYQWRQTVVHAERSTAQPGQVRSADRSKHQSAVCADVIHIICAHDRSRPAR